MDAFQSPPPKRVGTRNVERSALGDALKYPPGFSQVIELLDLRIPLSNPIGARGLWNTLIEISQWFHDCCVNFTWCNASRSASRPSFSGKFAIELYWLGLSISNAW